MHGTASSAGGTAHQLLQRMTQLHIHAYNIYILKLVANIGGATGGPACFSAAGECCFAAGLLLHAACMHDLAARPTPDVCCVIAFLFIS
jgi:hypothetical protein